NSLQLLQDEPGHDQLGIDDSRITDIGNSPVNDHTGIENQRLGPLELLGEFDIGDDEAKLVLGLQEGRDDHVARKDRDEQLSQALNAQRAAVTQSREAQVHVQDGLQRRPQEVADQEAQQQAKIDG